MDIARNGRFSHIIKGSELSKGLRRSKRNPRNSGFLVTCNGAVGRDGVLQIIDDLTRMTTTEVTDVFPFPQLFVFTNIIIVCSLTTIYEWVSGSLVSKLVVTAGGMWSAVDFHDYVYMSNGRVAVVRSAAAKTYAETTNLPNVTTMCNFNGQVLAGAPEVSGPGASLNINTDSGGLTMTAHGNWT